MFSLFWVLVIPVKTIVFSPSIALLCCHGAPFLLWIATGKASHGPVMVWVKIVTCPNVEMDGCELWWLNTNIYIYRSKYTEHIKTWLLQKGRLKCCPIGSPCNPIHNLDIARFVSVVGSVCGWLDPSSDWNVLGSTWINENFTKSLYSSQHRMNPWSCFMAKLVNRSQLLQECLRENLQESHELPQFFMVIVVVSGGSGERFPSAKPIHGLCHAGRGRTHAIGQESPAICHERNMGFTWDRMVIGDKTVIQLI